MVIPDYSRIAGRIRVIAIGATVALLGACATTPQRRETQYAPAAASLREARSVQVPVEKRAADYLHAAAITIPMLGSGTQEAPALDTYNTAAAELTILLRSSEGGRLWNQPLTVTSNNETYHLHLQAAGPAIWPPDYFNSFQLASSIKHSLVKKETAQQGVGGALVGVRNTTPRETFASLKGISAPVTATLDFRGKDVTLALRRPAKQPAALVEGKVRPLAADFSAPISYYSPPSNLTLVELMAALRSSHYIDKMGLYFLQPYDPDRIPVVFCTRSGVKSIYLGRDDQRAGSRPGDTETVSVLGLRLSYRNTHSVFRGALARGVGQSRQTTSESSSLCCGGPQHGRNTHSRSGSDSYS